MAACRVVMIRLLLVTCLLLPGCTLGPGILAVGWSTVVTNRGETFNPWFGLTESGERTIIQPIRSQPLPSERLLAEWGEPDSRVRLDDGTEQRTYRGGLRGVGVFLHAVILPIPLVLPTGFEHITFEIESGRVVHAWSVANAWGPEAAIGMPLAGDFAPWFAYSAPRKPDRFTNPFGWWTPFLIGDP